MALTREQKLQLLLLEKEKRRRQSAVPQIEEQPEYKEGVLSKLNRKAFNIVSGAVDIANAPYEFAGEAMRMPVEGDPYFRPPTILQKIGWAEKTKEPPANPFAIANRLLRAAAAGASALPEGLENAGGSARQAYYADRGVMGVVEDATLAMLTGKIAPNLANAPVDAALEVPGVVAKAGKAIVKGTGKKALRTLGPSDEALSLRYNRPEELAAAKNIDDLSSDFAANIDNLRDQVRVLDDEAWGTLLKLKAEPKSKILNILKGIRSDLIGKGGSKIGDADKQAVAKVDEYISRVQSLKQKGSTKGTEDFLDQEQLRDIVQSVRRDANYGDPKFEPLNNAIKSFAKGVDKQLKDNGNYKEVMEKLAPKTKALNDAIDEFKLQKDSQTGKFIPSNTTAQKLSLINKDKRPETKRVVKEIKEHTGVDFEDQVKLSKAKEEFVPGAERSRGSARTVAGSLGGMVLEPFIPGVQGLPTLVGGSVGRLADYYGGSASGKIIDAVRGSKTKIGEMFSGLNQSPAKSKIADLLVEVLRKQPVLNPFLRLNQ